MTVIPTIYIGYVGTHDASVRRYSISKIFIFHAKACNILYLLFSKNSLFWILWSNESTNRNNFGVIWQVLEIAITCSMLGSSQFLCVGTRRKKPQKFQNLYGKFFFAALFQNSDCMTWKAVPINPKVASLVFWNLSTKWLKNAKNWFFSKSCAKSATALNSTF